MKKMPIIYFCNVFCPVSNQYFVISINVKKKSITCFVHRIIILMQKFNIQIYLLLI